MQKVINFERSEILRTRKESTKHRTNSRRFARHQKYSRLTK